MKDKVVEILSHITVPKCCKSRKPPGNSRFHLRRQDYIKRCPKCGQLDRSLSFPTQPNSTKDSRECNRLPLSPFPAEAAKVPQGNDNKMGMFEQGRKMDLVWTTGVGWPTRLLFKTMQQAVCTKFDIPNI